MQRCHRIKLGQSPGSPCRTRAREQSRALLPHTPIPGLETRSPTHGRAHLDLPTPTSSCCRTGRPLSPAGDRAPISTTYGPAMNVAGTKDETLRWPAVLVSLSLIHISEPTRRTPISYAVFC